MTNQQVEILFLGTEFQLAGYHLKGEMMNFLKKWLGCILSFVAGVLGLALSACSGMVVGGNIDATALGAGVTDMGTEVTKGFEVITKGELYDSAKSMNLTSEFVALKVFAFITLIASILLIAYSVVLLLKNLNVIKCDHKAFNIITIALNSFLLVATIGLLITSCVYANAVEGVVTDMAKLSFTTSGLTAEQIAAIKFNISASVGLYQPLMLAFSAVSVITIIIISYLKRKDA